MSDLAGGPERAVRRDATPWLDSAPGKSFRPLRFEADGWLEIMRIEPGAGVPRHRHTGAVHAFNLAGTRRLATGAAIGPGDYVYEPAGTVDAWTAVGDAPCVVHLTIRGAIEYLDDQGEVTDVVNSASQRRLYLDWCRDHGQPPADEVLR